MNPARTEHHDGRDGLTDGLLDKPWTAWLPVITGLLHMQLALCGQLENLSRDQSGHVAAARTDALTGVLAERDRLIDQMVEINCQLAPFTGQLAVHVAKLPPPEQRTVRGLLDRIGESVERIRSQDEADRRELELLRKGVADELAGLVRGKGAMAAYSSGRVATAGSTAWAGGGRGQQG